MTPLTRLAGYVVWWLPVLGCTSFSSTPATGGADAGSVSDGSSSEIVKLGSSRVAFSTDVRTSVTLPAIPSAQPGDLVYAFVVWLTPASSPIVAPSGWTLKDSIDDTFEGHGASFYRVVPPGDPLKEHDFPLPASGRAGGILVTYRGVLAPPQHVVSDRAQSLTTNDFELKVPGLDLAEPGHLLFVVATTYDDPKTPVRISPPLRSVDSVGRLAAFEASLGVGQTGDYAIQDSFVALRATLTFLTVLRPAARR